MARLTDKNKSDYQVIRDCVTGLFYVGQIEIDPDGIVCPCAKISDFFDTFELADQKRMDLNGDNNA